MKVPEQVVANEAEERLSVETRGDMLMLWICDANLSPLQIQRVSLCRHPTAKTMSKLCFRFWPLLKKCEKMHGGNKLLRKAHYGHDGWDTAQLEQITNT